MQKWMSNLENIASLKEVGTCPYCGSDDTDYGYTLVNELSDMGYGDIWCNSCLHAFHMSRVVIDKDRLKETPIGLKY